jgi:EAL and modified HD-GYP domain-containing signal transduction protein
MLGWLTRLIGGPAPAAAPAASPLPVAQARPAAASAVQPSFGQRRPLVGRSGEVAGFELRLPGALEQRLAGRDDEPATAAHFAALLAATRVAPQGGRPLLVEVPAWALDRPGVAEQAGAGTLLVPTGAPGAAAVVPALRARGVRVGVPDGPPNPATTADFVLLHATAGGVDTLLLSAQRWHEARPQLPLVALGLENVDDVERALASGITLAGGRFSGAVAERAARPLQAAAHRICGLLNDLALDRDTALVAEAVRADVALSYRLLRYANSPAMGLARGVETVEQAVMLLGRAELGRWLSVMLLSAAAGRQASAALQEDALARGRLLELLARQRGVDHPELLFTVGLFSRLHLLLEMPLAAALKPLRLSADALQALLQGLGPWAAYLALAEELERDDEVRFAALCAPFGGMAPVLAEAGRAWDWAAQVAG